MNSPNGTQEFPEFQLEIRLVTNGFITLNNRFPNAQA